MVLLNFKEVVMQDVRQELRDLAYKARGLHFNERQITLASVELIGELDRRNAAVNLEMTSEHFAQHIGLTPSVFWKRAQAARVLHRFPRARALLIAGETEVSHLALLAPRVTEANADVLFTGILNKSRREVEGFLSRLTPDGRLVDREEDVELRLRLTRSQLEALDRARDVLSHSGHVPSLAEIMVKALADLLERRDPLRRAERAEARRVKKDREGLDEAQTQGTPAVETAVSSANESPAVEAVGLDDPSPAKEVATSRSLLIVAPPVKGSKRERVSIPAAVRHSIVLRDGGQCSWIFPDGARCPQRGMLELDHVGVMHCRGGDDTVENCGLRCRQHNQHAAERALGRAFMAKARESRSL
jgi:hypothetical protein